jgi:plastocyanin
MRHQSVLCAIAVISVLAMGCGGGGGGNNNPNGPSPNPDPGGGGGGGTTFTITSAGVSPRSITVSPGTRVTFVNNDAVPHEMNSDPHPNHGDCPAIDQVGFLAQGQSKQTGNLNDVRTCGFHDHNRPDVVALQGTIVIR